MWLVRSVLRYAVILPDSAPVATLPRDKDHHGTVGRTDQQLDQQGGRREVGTLLLLLHERQQLAFHLPPSLRSTRGDVDGSAQRRVQPHLRRLRAHYACVLFPSLPLVLPILTWVLGVWVAGNRLVERGKLLQKQREHLLQAAFSFAVLHSRLRLHRLHLRARAGATDEVRRDWREQALPVCARALLADMGRQTIRFVVRK